MTDAYSFEDPPHTTWRGRMRRTLRRHSRHAGRDSLIAVAISALVVGVGQFSGLFDGEVAEAVEERDDVVFSAVMVGDLMYGRHVEAVTSRRGYDHMLSYVQPLLEADYLTGNLENVISDDPDALPEADKLIHLSSSSQTAAALANAGFNVVSLANNHIMDHGIPGLRDTIAALEAHDVGYAGAGESLDEAMQIHYEEHGDLTVATLSFTDSYVIGFIARAFQGGALSASEGRAARLISEADANADLVIAHFHWGEEYAFAPNSTQRELAEMAANAGADIVVGHHPHVLQRVEQIGDTLVMYSLGNFVFDQGWTRTRESTIARYELLENGQARVEFVPIEVRDGAPREVNGPLAAYHRERIFQRLRSDSLPWERQENRLVTMLDHSFVLEGDRSAPTGPGLTPGEEPDDDDGLGGLPGVPAPEPDDTAEGDEDLPGFVPDGPALDGGDPDDDADTDAGDEPEDAGSPGLTGITAGWFWS